MRLSIDIPDELHRGLRIKAINEGTTVTAVVKRLLEDYVGGKKVAVKDVTVFKNTGYEHVIDKTIHVPPPSGPRPAPDPPPPPNFVRPISKEDQAKGRSRK